jgi:hypothetical protein
MENRKLPRTNDHYLHAVLRLWVQQNLGNGTSTPVPDEVSFGGDLTRYVRGYSAEPGVLGWSGSVRPRN